MEVHKIEFVIAGELTALSVEDAEAKILARGGVLKTDVSENTSYLVAGASAGSKLEKAEALGITVLTEEQFLALLGSDQKLEDQKSGQLGLGI